MSDLVQSTTPDDGDDLDRLGDEVDT